MDLWGSVQRASSGRVERRAHLHAPCVAAQEYFTDLQLAFAAATAAATAQATGGVGGGLVNLGVDSLLGKAAPAQQRRVEGGTRVPKTQGCGDTILPKVPVGTTGGIIRNFRALRGVVRLESSGRSVLLLPVAARGARVVACGAGGHALHPCTVIHTSHRTHDAESDDNERHHDHCFCGAQTIYLRCMVVVRLVAHCIMHGVTHM